MEVELNVQGMTRHAVKQLWTDMLASQRNMVLEYNIDVPWN